LGAFEFAIVGVPLVASTIAIVVLFGPRLLPSRNGRIIPSDLTRHARTLIDQTSSMMGYSSFACSKARPTRGRRGTH
jgi:hypothetical protein